MLKTVAALYLCGHWYIFPNVLMSSKNRIYLKSKWFCNSLKVFTVTFEKKLKCRSWRNTLRSDKCSVASYRVFLLSISSLLSDLVFIPGGKVKKPKWECWIWYKITSHFICLSISNSSSPNQKAGCTMRRLLKSIGMELLQDDMHS